MKYIVYKNIAIFVLLLFPTLFFNEISAGTSEGDYDYSHRKRDCEITLVGSDGQPLTQTLIGITQLSNDFVFGGTIGAEGFDTLGDAYGEWFRSYFDVATPEKEMNWEYVMNCSEKCNPDFSKADFLVDWLTENNISVYGNNLFRNEKEALIPEWTRELQAPAFKQAMQERIDSAMGHFKGKVIRWKLINEICHGENGSLPASGMLQTRSNDPDIYSWIMDEARKKDQNADFIINDYNLITSNDLTAADIFINRVKPICSKFDIIGAEGHFSTNMDRSSYESNINYLAEQLGKPVWLTDVNFYSDTSLAPDKIEELMRTCFANPKVGGLCMGSWCRHFMPGSLTNYFVDSLGHETPVGQRWREVRAEWKSGAGGYTDESGKFSFNGFLGKYQVLNSCFTDTIFLVPGEGTQSIEVSFTGSAIRHASADLKTTEISINGITVPINLPARYHKQLFLNTYSLSGQQLSSSPVNPAGCNNLVTPASSCCRVFRIETVDRQPLFTGKMTAVR